MKKIILVPLAILFCISFQSMAQNEQQMERQDQRLKKIISKLSMDENQAAKFTEIYQKRQEDIRGQREIEKEKRLTAKSDRMEAMRQRKELNENYRQQLKEVLSDQQLEQLDKMMEERKNRKQFERKNKALKIDGQHPDQRIMKEQPNKEEQDSGN